MVRCFGFITDPVVNVVYEYCEHGSCIDARKKGLMKFLEDDEKLEILIKTCCGLTYILTQGMLHLDIAARNILLDEYLTPKVADFGRSQMVRAGEVYVTDEPMQPLKWLAPETMLNRHCSEKTEVWAFGVFMWEIITDNEPYSDLSPTEACLSILREGRRLPLTNIPYDSLRNLIASCWEANPDARPTLREAGVVLTKTVLPEVIKHSRHESYMFASLPQPGDLNASIVSRYRREKYRSLMLLRRSNSCIHPNSNLGNEDEKATKYADVTSIHKPVSATCQPITSLVIPGSITRPVSNNLPSNLSVTSAGEKLDSSKTSSDSIPSYSIGNEISPGVVSPVYKLLPTLSQISSASSTSPRLSMTNNCSQFQFKNTKPRDFIPV